MLLYSIKIVIFIEKVSESTIVSHVYLDLFIILYFCFILLYSTPIF